MKDEFHFGNIIWMKVTRIWDQNFIQNNFVMMVITNTVKM